MAKHNHVPRDSMSLQKEDFPCDITADTYPSDEEPTEQSDFDLELELAINKPLPNKPARLKPIFPAQEIDLDFLKLGVSKPIPPDPSPANLILSELPNKVLTTLCTHLELDSLLALRSTNRPLRRELAPNFNALFTRVKICLTPRSLALLEALSIHEEIAAKIEHMTIGTETLSQYLICMENMEGDEEVVEEQRRQFAAVLNEENDARTFMADALTGCLMRLPNLHTILIEDRPVQKPASSSSSAPSEYRTFMGSAHISRRTGIDFSWNGPYDNTFPSWSRQYTFIAVFCTLRNLRIMGSVVTLDLLVGGYEDTEGTVRLCEPFDHTKRIAREAMVRHLSCLDFRDVDQQGSWVRGLRDIHSALMTARGV
ncbi:hypothetical protein K504DRAFT_501066 [Pleomassaria siparia CBS 279.74]|uniref:F-box domain-containing protein n=1 Tax=Pleomassaria siparia CBS 279.74 TaxID=1314801 RepID=A0A6G1KED9_9PLEO|nr:hypothetical protein K504DRAFT_501066 [Pleomassaria siparia CBS 279.74]